MMFLPHPPMSTLAVWLRIAVAAALLGGCAGGSSHYAQPDKNLALVKGPPIGDVITPFDQALMCLRGRVRPDLAFSVGAIVDQTGKEQITDGGTGKFVTQGAGDMVQSALFRTGVTVLNRRDPRILETELKWGLRTAKSIIPSNYFVTGSITSLDFLPGGGFDVKIGGVGPQYRQHRILVGLDLSLTDTRTGRVVANVPLQKQIYASEFSFGVGRFIGDELVLLDFGGSDREALHFVLRQMLNLATFELLTQVMPTRMHADCRAMIDTAYGLPPNTAAENPTRAGVDTESTELPLPPRQIPAPSAAGTSAAVLVPSNEPATAKPAEARATEPAPVEAAAPSPAKASEARATPSSEPATKPVEADGNAVTTEPSASPPQAEAPSAAKANEGVAEPAAAQATEETSPTANGNGNGNGSANVAAPQRSQEEAEQIRQIILSK